MNQHNQLFHAINRIACSNHRRDDQGWPLGNCIECTTFRKKMDAWYGAQVMDGNPRPEQDNGIDKDRTHDRATAWVSE